MSDHGYSPYFNNYVSDRNACIPVFNSQYDGEEAFYGGNNVAMNPFDNPAPVPDFPSNTGTEFYGTTGFAANEVAISETDQDAEGSPVQQEFNFNAQDIALPSITVQPLPQDEVSVEQQQARHHERAVAAFSGSVSAVLFHPEVGRDMIKSLKPLCPLKERRFSKAAKKNLRRARREWMKSNRPGDDIKKRHVFLLIARMWRFSYAEIHNLGEMTVTLPTLRGNMRMITKPAEARLRKPAFSEADDLALIDSYNALTGAGVQKALWLSTAQRMARNGHYLFGPTAIKKRWEKLEGEGRVTRQH